MALTSGQIGLFNEAGQMNFMNSPDYTTVPSGITAADRGAEQG
jgi:hypothetical protein